MSLAGDREHNRTAAAASLSNEPARHGVFVGRVPGAVPDLRLQPVRALPAARRPLAYVDLFLMRHHSLDPFRNAVPSLLRRRLCAYHLLGVEGLATQAAPQTIAGAGANEG